MKKHCVFFKGRVEFSSDSEDEDKILDEAYDLVFGDADADVTILNMEIDDEEDEESEEEAMTYGDIYNEFCEKFPNARAIDYRPADPMHIPQLMRGIPNGIIVWLEDGSKVVYIAESEK